MSSEMLCFLLGGGGVGPRGDQLSHQEWTARLKAGGTSVVFKIDTGTDVSVMSVKDYRKMRWYSALTPAAKRLKSPGGEVQCRGTFTTQTRYKGTYHKMELYVVEWMDRNLLS